MSRYYQRKPVNDDYETTDSISMKQVIKKIKDSEWAILYSPWCSYSKSALQLFKKKNITPTAIDIESISGSINEIQMGLAKDDSIGFPSNYSTRPMIFMNGKWLGGYRELNEYFS
jgi:glutaredoxin